jgi:hypothetical protein
VSNDWPQLEYSLDSGIVEGFGSPSLIVEEGGHAGIVCSVGGSGGQMSVSSGIPAFAGAASSGVDRSARPACGLPCPPPAGGQVSFGEASPD